MGLEALKVGYGGNKAIAEEFGLDAHTIGKGKQELIEKAYNEEGIRQTGAGRSPKEIEMLLWRVKEIVEDLDNDREIVSSMIFLLSAMDRVYESEFKFMKPVGKAIAVALDIMKKL